MKSRFFATFWLSLLLLCSQQLAFADALKNVQRAHNDYQCAYEEGSCKDGGAVQHLALDDLDNALSSSVVASQSAEVVTDRVQTPIQQFLSISLPYYLSRAPPVL